jgi:hypothetical protein
LLDRFSAIGERLVEFGQVQPALQRSFRDCGFRLLFASLAAQEIAKLTEHCDVLLA